MSMTLFATTLGGLFGSIGIVGIFLGSLAKDHGRRNRLWKIGAVAMATGGLVLTFANLVGWVGSNEFFGGLLLVLFGSAVDARAPNKTRPQETTSCAG